MAWNRSSVGKLDGFEMAWDASSSVLLLASTGKNGRSGKIFKNIVKNGQSKLFDRWNFGFWQKYQSAHK